MGIGVSIFLIAVGAVLAFAVHSSLNGVDVQTIGWILMGAGALGLLLTMLIFNRDTYRVGAVREERVVRERPTTIERDVY